MAEKKCEAKFEPMGVQCSLEEGHLVQEALPYEAIESKHQFFGRVQNGKESTFCSVSWD